MPLPATDFTATLHFFGNATYRTIAERPGRKAMVFDARLLPADLVARRCAPPLLHRNAEGRCRLWHAGQPAPCLE